MASVIVVDTLMNGKFAFTRKLDAETFKSFFSERNREFIEIAEVKVYDGPLQAWETLNKNGRTLATSIEA